MHKFLLCLLEKIARQFETSVEVRNLIEDIFGLRND
jgi:hypothetical protein